MIRLRSTKNTLKTFDLEAWFKKHDPTSDLTLSLMLNMDIMSLYQLSRTGNLQIRKAFVRNGKAENFWQILFRKIFGNYAFNTVYDYIIETRDSQEDNLNWLWMLMSWLTTMGDTRITFQNANGTIEMQFVHTKDAEINAYMIIAILKDFNMETEEPFNWSLIFPNIANDYKSPQVVDNKMFNQTTLRRLSNDYRDVRLYYRLFLFGFRMTELVVPAFNIDYVSNYERGISLQMK